MKCLGKRLCEGEMIESEICVEKGGRLDME